MSTELEDERIPTAPTPASTDLAAHERWAVLFDLGPRDFRVLEATHAQREAVVDELLERFYARLRAVPEFHQFVRVEPQRLARLRELHRAHFLTLEEGWLDAASLIASLRGPETSLQLHSLQWYVAPFSLYLTLAVTLLADAMRGSADLVPAIEALIKTAMCDLSAAIETYVGDAFVSRQTVTELARSERSATDALKKEQEAARSKADLVHMLIHDLRNPVQAIALQANIALRIASKSLDLEDHLVQIERACRDLSRLLQGLLEAAELESGQMPVASQPLRVTGFLNEMLDQHVPTIQQAGMRLTRALDPDLPTISADPGLFGRVLMNLIVNAVHHSGSPEVRVEATADADVVSTRAIDYGCGIPVADQGRVFEKFASGTLRKPRNGEASGLGLYFCRLATERMGGELQLTSQPGLTVFEVRLPTMSTRLQ